MDHIEYVSPGSIRLARIIIWQFAVPHVRESHSDSVRRSMIASTVPFPSRSMSWQRSHRAVQFCSRPHRCGSIDKTGWLESWESIHSSIYVRMGFFSLFPRSPCVRSQFPTSPFTVKTQLVRVRQLNSESFDCPVPPVMYKVTRMNLLVRQWTLISPKKNKKEGEEEEELSNRFGSLTP